MEKRIYKFKKYLSEISNKINSLLTYENKIILLEAPTGAGKTFLFSEIIKKHSEDYNNILCPNKIQVLQNETLGLKPFVGKTRIELLKEKKICSVFDKINEYQVLVNYLIQKEDYNKKINIIIDEAHILVLAYNYRQQAIKNILNLIDTIKNNPQLKCNIVFMSATVECLEFFPIDLYIKCEKENYKSNVGKIEIKRFNYKSARVNFQQFILRSLLNEEKQCFIRYNNKEKVNQLIKTLEEKYFKKSAFINANEKDFLVNSSGEILYKNKYYGAVIKEGTLLNDTDFIFTTSILDQGTSITKGNKDLVLYFIVDNANQMIFDNIIQFLNRCRYNINKCVILLNKIDETYAFNEYEEVYNFYLEKANLKANLANKAIEALKEENANEKDIKELFSYCISVKNMYGKYENYELLDYDEKTQRVIINYCYISFISYLDYCKIDYYNHHRLIEKLKDKLNIPVIYNEINSIDKIELSNTKQQKQNKIKFEDTKKLIKKIKPNDITNLENYIKYGGTINNTVVNELLSYKFFKETILFSYKNYIDINKFINIFKKAKSKTEISKLLYEEQLKVQNIMFIESGYNYSNLFLNEQRVIIKKLYNPSIKKKRISKEKIKSVQEELNSLSMSKYYTIEDIDYLIKTIFLYEIDNENKQIKIISLRTK